MFSGKGMWLWRLAAAGAAESLAQLAKVSGFSHVIIKILDGVTPYNKRAVPTNLGYRDDLIPEYVSAFRRFGIRVFGYQYVYLLSPTSEGIAAKKRVETMKLDGLVCDVERECKGKPLQTKEYLTALRGINCITALSSYRYPSLHPEISWEQWIASLDVMMPQVYWQGAYNAGQQLLRSLNEYAKLTKKPYIPTGSAYSEHGWSATPAQVQEFMDVAKRSGLTGVNFWEWVEASSIPNMWNAISNFEWNPGPPPPITCTPEEFVVNYLYPAAVKEWGYNGPKPVI